jgi:hypothetical protein
MSDFSQATQQHFGGSEFVRRLANQNDRMFAAIQELGLGACQRDPHALEQLVVGSIRELFVIIEETGAWPAEVYDWLSRGFRWAKSPQLSFAMAMLADIHRVGIDQWSRGDERDNPMRDNPMRDNPMANRGEDHTFELWCCPPEDVIRARDALNSLIASASPLPGEGRGVWACGDRRELWLLVRFAVIVFYAWREAAIGRCYVEADRGHSTLRVAFGRPSKS